MSRPERPSYGEDGKPIPAGWIAERFSTTDVHLPGTFWNASTPWCQTALMLFCLEVPSLYVVTDQAFVHAFDTILVDAVHADSNRLELTVTNPTAFPARYQLMQETSADLTKPLPPFHFTKFMPVNLAPGQTTTFALK